MQWRWQDLQPLDQMKQGYEPDPEEIIQYGKYLGLILPQQQRYLPIARQGLIASLPPFWQPCQAPNGQIYFRNKKTRKISQQNPLDEIYRQKINEVRQFEGKYGIEPISQESALRESSGVLGNSKLRREMKEMRDSYRYQGNVYGENLMEGHITEESVYSDEGSGKEIEIKKGYKKQIVEEVPQWKRTYLEALRKHKAQFDAYFPPQQHLITTYSTLPGDYKNLSKMMDPEKLKNLVTLKLRIAQKKVDLQKQRQQSRRLEQLQQYMHHR